MSDAENFKDLKPKDLRQAWRSKLGREPPAFRSRTRKSSEEGLEQNFNSLDAQREACAAYILSQAGEGWAGLKALH